MKILRLAKPALRSVLCAVHVMLVSELFLRFVAPQAMMPRHVMAGNYGIRVNEPNATYWHTSSDFKVLMHTNAKGLRAKRDIPYEKPPNVKRIVILGDSFGMGYEVSFEDMFATRMEADLDNAGYETEVVNLSVSGYGNAEELIALQEEGLKYHPDLVLVAWNSSDYDDNVRCSLFELRDGELFRKNTSYLPGVHLQETLQKWKVYGVIAEKSQLYSLLRGVITGQAKPILARLAGARGAVEEGPAEKSRYSIQLAGALLQEITRVSNAANAKCLILDIPVRNTRTETYSVFPHDSDGGTFGLSPLSPIDEFGRHRGELIYWEDSEGHFTPLGCRLVGDVLAAHILKDRLLEKDVTGRLENGSK